MRERQETVFHHIFNHRKENWIVRQGPILPLETLNTRDSFSSHFQTRLRELDCETLPNVVNDEFFSLMLDHERNCQTSHGNERILQS